MKKKTIKRIGASMASHAKLVIALRMVEDVCRQKADYWHESWNPDAHVEITLTIADCRQISEALKSRAEPWCDPEDDCDADD